MSAAPIATNVFSMGFNGLLDAWLANEDDERVYGLADLVDDQDLLWSARCLADELLAQFADPGSDDFIVEFSHSHLRSVGAIVTLYPDAYLLHVVRDGGDVAARLASSDRELYWPRPSPLTRSAAQQWCDEQRAVDEFSSEENYLLVRIERVLDDPTAFLNWFSGGVGIDLDEAALLPAVDALGAGAWTLRRPRAGRAQALVNALGADLLEKYGYPPTPVGEVAALAGRVELAYERATARARDALLQAGERLRTVGDRLDVTAAKEQR